MLIHTLIILEGSEDVEAHIAGVASFPDIDKAKEALKEDYTNTRNGYLGGDTEDEWDFDPEEWFEEDTLSELKYRLVDGAGNYTYAEIRTYSF